MAHRSCRSHLACENGPRRSWSPLRLTLLSSLCSSNVASRSLSFQFKGVLKRQIVRRQCRWPRCCFRITLPCVPTSLGLSLGHLALTACSSVAALEASWVWGASKTGGSCDRRWSRKKKVFVTLCKGEDSTDLCPCEHESLCRRECSSVCVTTDNGSLLCL